MLRAEILRSRVESLGALHNVPITASFGVASVPETSSAMADVVPMADAALYDAKQEGRNRVKAATRRAPADRSRPQLAVG
jgi:diguanylate cyclase (GGDEF)-like protein